MEDGETFFSVQTNFFSKKLGRKVQPGDLLTDLGAVVKANAEPVKPFIPADPTNNFGSKAIYGWPSGEIWFSTPDGFYDSNSNFYAPGDLLSDQGYVVYRNSELFPAFQPPGGGTDFGLAALFVVTDAAAAGPAPNLGLPQPTNSPPASVTIQRSGGSQMFQLERATNAAGPYIPVSPITTDTLFLDTGALTNQAQLYYRLHQW